MIVGDSSYQPIIEESIHIFLAASREEADEKAFLIGKRGEHSYKNDQEEDVHWQFVNVLEIQSLSTDTIEDGMEVFSYMYRDQS